jgi:hypothetical protein
MCTCSYALETHEASCISHQALIVTRTQQTAIPRMQHTDTSRKASDRHDLLACKAAYSDQSDYYTVIFNFLHCHKFVAQIERVVVLFEHYV